MIQQLIHGLPGLISAALETNPLLGYAAVAFVMLLENLIPPIPSEVLMGIQPDDLAKSRCWFTSGVITPALGLLLGRRLATLSAH